MKITSCNKTILAALIASLALVGSGIAQTIIYQDNFSGSVSASLNGLAPTIDNGPNPGSDKWTDMNPGDWTANGAYHGPFTSYGGDIVSLPISGLTSGNIYTLSANLTENGGTPVGLTFGGNISLNSPGLPAIWLDSSRNVTEIGYNYGGYAINYGPTTTNSVNGGLAKITLDTTLANWTATYEYNGSTVFTTTLSTTQRSALTSGAAVGLFGGQYNGYPYPTGDSVSNFSFAVSSVPEPATIWTALMGIVGLVGFKSIKRNRI